MTDAAETVLRRRLRAMRWSRRETLERRCVYRGPADFVLRHGKVYHPRVSPVVVPKLCFGNSLVTAIRLDGAVYVEGFVLPPIGHFLEDPIHHAWVEENGQAWEITWPSLGAAYLGVEFSVERADDCTWNGDASVLDDDHRSWPLFGQRWDGEPSDVTWPPDVYERIEAIRTLRPIPNTGTERKP